MDTMFSMYFGFYALIFSLIGYLTGYIKQIFYEEDMTLPIVVIGAADIFYGIIIYLCTFLTRGRMDFYIIFQKNYSSRNGLHTDPCRVPVPAVQLDQPED